MIRHQVAPAKDLRKLFGFQEIVDFVVYLLDLIMERFSDAEQMQQGLPACIDDAIEMLDMAKYDAQARIKIRGMLLHFLCEDNE